MAEFFVRLMNMTSDFITCPLFLFVGLPLLALWVFKFIFYIIHKKRYKV